MAELQDVVITGRGLICATGRGCLSLWDRLDHCESALQPLPVILDDPAFASHRAGTIPEQLLATAFGETGIRGRDDRSVKLALLASHDALAEAGLLDDAVGRKGCGSIIGTGVGALSPTVEVVTAYNARGVRGVRPTSIPRSMPSTAACAVSIRYGLQGPTRTVAAACASATMAMGDAFRLVRHGYASRVLCGGTDALGERLLYAAWNNMRILSSGEGTGGGCRPFDANPGGMVLGEGAGMLVLESAASAAARGAPVLGCVVGYGESSDAAHITQPDPAGQLPALQAALASAGASVEQIGAVQAHGTGAEASDSAESRSLGEFLGEAAARVPVVSTKPTTGHTLGASGAIETLISLAWLEHGKVTPNLSLQHRRADCGLHLPMSPAPLGKALVLNCAFAFGGSNAALLLAGA